MKRNTKQIPTDLETAWQYGRDTAQFRLTDIIYGDMAPGWIFDDFTSNEFFEIGRAGLELPQYATGWRYGDIPACGRSKNYREDRLERGVSVMALDGGAKIKTLAEKRGSFDNRPVVRVGGWINPLDDGGDGEPLLLAAHTI